MPVHSDQNITIMLSQENKISRGLTKLLSSERSIRHFKTSPEVFVENPGVISAYFDLFSQAQLNEFANHE